VFLKTAEDDRSDNDENEFQEEQRLDALARQGREQPSSPKVLVNGQAVSSNGNGKTSATEVRTNGITKRKENVRKA